MNLKPYLLRMTLTLLIMSGMGFFFASGLWAIFLSNPWLNLLIISLTFGGIGYAFYQLIRLKKDAYVLTDLKQGQWSFSSQEKTLFLEPLLSFLSDKKSSRDPSSARSLGESLADQLENERVFPRYLVGLLVFLGLLGTFWGLSQTITSIAHLLQSMPSNIANTPDFFNLLKQNLQNPLGGMGTAFSSSLFGLGGSLLIGFLELQVGHAYSRFLNEVNLYLTISFKTSSALPSSSPLSYLQALLSRNSEGMDQLTQLMEKSEKNERQTALLLDKLITSLTFLVEQNKTHHSLMAKLAEGQNLHEESLKRLQNIELVLTHFLQGQREDREEFVKKLKEEMRLIARTIGNLSEQQRMAS